MLVNPTPNRDSMVERHAKLGWSGMNWDTLGGVGESSGDQLIW